MDSLTNYKTLIYSNIFLGYVFNTAIVTKPKQKYNIFKIFRLIDRPLISKNLKERRETVNRKWKSLTKRTQNAS